MGFNFEQITLTTTHQGQTEEMIQGKRFIQDDWLVTLEHNEEKMTLDFHMGSGWNGEAPMQKNVMYCLINDYFGYQNARDIEDYASEYGMDYFEDRERVEEVFDKVAKQAEDIERLFTSEEIEAMSKALQDY